MSDTNTCTLSGIMVEQASASETQGGVPIANFQVQSRRDYLHSDGGERAEYHNFKVRAFAHGANSIIKYGGAGIEVILSGHLTTEHGRMLIVAQEVGFPSVSQCRHRNGA